MKEIVEANLRNSDFGVSELARQVGVSRSTLYTKVNLLTQQSVSRFIRKIRLAKALELVRESDLTISEIAYEVGFSSPSYFIKCFHDFYGYPPGETIARMEDPPSLNFRTRLSCLFARKSVRLLAYSLLALLILLSVLLVYTSSHSHLHDNSKSIAVLPFSNLSNDSNNQYFADGIMEEIVQDLSQIRELRVVSVTSTRQYRQSTKPIHRIARELDVSHILEGSVLKRDDEVRIVAQLIEADRDKIVWSQTFDVQLKNIFDLQTQIANQVASNLTAAVSPMEQEQIQKRYSLNTDAYTLYLKGRFYWKQRSESSLKTSIDFYQMALQLDPQYALAYAGLADSYLSLTFDRYYLKEEGFELAEEYAQKALAINDQLCEAHAVLGNIATWYKRDWVLAEQELLKSIQLNPNYSTSHQYYAELLALLGRMKESVKEINFAIILDPNNPSGYLLRANRFYNMGNFEQALSDAQKAISIKPNYVSAHWTCFRILYHQKKDKDALAELKTIFQLADPEKKHSQTLDKCYSEEGLQACVSWAIIQIENNPKITRFSPYYKYKLMAELYAMIGEQELALEYLQQHAQSELFKPAWIKYGIEFKSLRNDPRFSTLLVEMGLENT